MASLKMASLLFCIAASVVFLGARDVDAERFIMFSPFGSKGHLNVFYPIADALAERGHDVTIVSPFPARKDTKNVGKKGGKVLEIMIDTKKQMQGSDRMKKMLGNFANEQNQGIWDTVETWIMFSKQMPRMCSIVLDSPEMRQIMAEGKQYDVAFNNAFMNDCTLPVAANTSRHVIMLSATGLLLQLAYDLNIPHPISYIPSILVKVQPPLNFLDRMYSSAAALTFWALHNMLQTPLMNSAIQEKYPGLPSIREVKDNVSMLFLNRVAGVDGPLPTMPYVAEIGGIVGRPAKPLPKEFEDFIQGAGDAGFIYMALGSVVPEELMTESRKRIIIEAFSRLNLRVIWKFKEKRTDIPPNVKTVDWAPQQDVLGHPKLRAFISHGGHMSLDEALHHGAPVLGMPVFGDQPANVFRAQAMGFALELTWDDLTVEAMLERLNEIVNNTRYKEAAVRYAKIMNDQELHPLDRAIYWTEYVLRHNGARHLWPAAGHLNFFQYFLLDIAAVAVTIVTLVLYVTFKLIGLICCRSKTKQKKVKKN